MQTVGMLLIERFHLTTTQLSGAWLTNLCDLAYLDAVQFNAKTKKLLWKISLEPKAFISTKVFVSEILMLSNVKSGALYIDVNLNSSILAINIRRIEKTCRTTSLWYYLLGVVDAWYAHERIVIYEFNDLPYSIFGYTDSLYCFTVQEY